MPLAGHGLRPTALRQRASRPQLKRDPLGRDGGTLPIDVELQDEQGQTLARYDGPAVTRMLVERADSTSACVRFIDPYGNTTFNQLQLSILVRELEALESRTRDGQAQVTRALLAFLRQASDRVHTYVKFIGD